MKIKTSELSGKALNWAVWVATGEIVEPNLDGGYDGIGNYSEPWSPSTNWAQGGPIIDREQISVVGGNQIEAPELAYPFRFESFFARMPRQQAHQDHEGGHGPTHLIAAMRCVVASKLGDEVDIPEELLA